MYKYLIEGGSPLCGEVEISPAKNSVLTLICASTLLSGGVLIEKCPKIGDVIVMCDILRKIGATIVWTKDGLYVNAENIRTADLPREETKKIRASFFLSGALLKKFGKVTLYKPGGCKIGERGLDIHLAGLEKLGAKVYETEEKFVLTCEELRGTNFILRYPSVGATENLILAAATAKGETVLKNCAKEPEVKDLCDFLNLCGAKIYGAGTNEIRIIGVKKLKGNLSYSPVLDRIEAGTFLLLFLLVGGKGEIKFDEGKNIYSLTKKILDNTCNYPSIYVKIYREKICVRACGEAKGLGKIITAPYPGFPTDLHPILAAYAATLQGETTVEERIFDSRFLYLDQLKKMGADFIKNGNAVTFKGAPLHGAEVIAPDLRGGAGLVLAALKAQEKSTVLNADAVMRGYEDFDGKLRKLGAKIKLTKG